MDDGSLELCGPCSTSYADFEGCRHQQRMTVAGVCYYHHHYIYTIYRVYTHLVFCKSKTDDSNWSQTSKKW